ncbi:MAG: dihydrofolate reductase family protein [Chloroflexota bacterium]
MSRVRVQNLFVSLDGYATGEGQSLELPFGTAQATFAPWFERIGVHGAQRPTGPLGADETLLAGWGSNIGAEIMGRNKFRPTTGPWPDDGWRGWWGEEPPFHTPCFVWTHHPREPMAVGETTFHFVSGTPQEVLALARDAAGGKDVRIGGGPTTVNEYLAADLVDYLHIVVIPVLLGRGVSPWTGLEGIHDRFETQSLVAPSGATHLFMTRTPR